MLNLPKYDLSSRQWLDLHVPLRNTLLEALFPDVRFAIVHANPGQYDEMVTALSSPIEGPSPELAEGLRLDFASGGRKHGDFFLSHRWDGPRVASRFWSTAEEAMAYGGALVTDCLDTYSVPDLCVLVVEDGDYGTGDCHAKAGPQLWALLEGDERQALQFRLAVLDGDGQGHGHIAKGTAVVQRPGDPDHFYDLIIPLSAFKSHKPALGAHLWDAHVGVVGWSEFRPTKVSYTILQWFSKQAIDADVWPRAEPQIERLVAAGQSSEAAIEYFKLDQLAGEYDEDDGLLFNILRNDVHGRLTHHPYVVDRLTRLLRRKWLHLATGGGLRWVGLMGLPWDDGGSTELAKVLDEGEICAPQLPEGLVIGTRYPVRFWADLKLWRNVHRPGLTRHRGVVWMSHETALQVGGDFDGDYFLLTPASKFPALAGEIESWRHRDAPEIAKSKERLASPLDGPNLARVAMDNVDNMVGLITYFVAQANAMRRLDLVAALAPELQIAVDKFKYNLTHDTAKIWRIASRLEPLGWLHSHKWPETFISKPLALDIGAEDTISHLAAQVNEGWQPPKLSKRPLQEFAPLFPATRAHRQAALKLNARYAVLIRQAMRRGDKNAFRPIFQALRQWADTRPDPEQWAAALWHAVHRRGAHGSGSLAFNAFPRQVMAAIHRQPETPERVAIVGLPYNDYAEDLDQFDGRAVTVQVVAEVLGGQLRSAVIVIAGERVAGRRLGFVSQETPLPTGLYTLQLSRQGQVVYGLSA
jgi:hypothetical protein